VEIGLSESEKTNKIKELYPVFNGKNGCGAPDLVRPAGFCGNPG
jgi:hypothetical protein